MNEFFTEDINEDIDYEEETIDLIDPFNPFDNPTENSRYNESYVDIVPQIQLEGCKIPNIPSPEEKSRIRKFYNLAGGGIIFHFVMALVLVNAFNLTILLVMMFMNGMSFSEFINGKANEIQQYINTTAISPAITILSYLAANLSAFFIGTKIAGYKLKSFFRTTDFTFLNVIQYILIAFFLQYIAGTAINIVQMLMAGSDVFGTSTSFNNYYTPKYALLTIMYSCIVAPVTEELLYRGFVLKSFSRVSQRFGILLSAFFFGLSHGNIAQFILAFSVGIFMAYIDIRHNSILPSIIVHIAVNTLSTATTVVNNYFSASQIATVILNVSVIALAIAGLVMFVRFAKNSIFPKSDIRQQYRSINIALTSPCVIIAVVIYLAFTLFITFG